MYVFFPVLRRDFTVFREGTVTFTVIELRLRGNDGVRRSPSLTRIIATGRIFLIIFFQGTVTLSRKWVQRVSKSVRCTLWAPRVEF